MQKPPPDDSELRECAMCAEDAKRRDVRPQAVVAESIKTKYFI